MIARDEPNRFDWDAAKRRLDDALRSLSESDQLSPEQSQNVLRERARQLAQPPDTQPDTSEVFEVVGFKLGEESFAIATRYALELIEPRKVTPIPQAADHFVEQGQQIGLAFEIVVKTLEHCDFL